jgi:hypothetical protein
MANFFIKLVKFSQNVGRILNFPKIWAKFIKIFQNFEFPLPLAFMQNQEPMLHTTYKAGFYSSAYTL